MADGERKKWFTTRKVFSLLGLAISVVMVYTGKMDAGTWVEALAVITVGHHAADVIKAAKGTS